MQVGSGLGVGAPGLSWGTEAELGTSGAPSLSQGTEAAAGERWHAGVVQRKVVQQRKAT